MNNFYFFLSKILNPLLNPLNILFLFLIVLGFSYLKSKNKLIFKIFILNITIITLIAFLPLGKYGLNYLEKDFQNQNQYKNISNILVLPGADSRIIASVNLANFYKKSKIYYIGLNFYNDEKNSSYDVRARNFYENMNFDMNRVKFVGTSKNTIENLTEIENLKLKDSETILLTSAYHMKRSIMIAKKKNLNLLPYAVDIASKDNKNLLNTYKSFDVVNNMIKFNLYHKNLNSVL